VTLRPLGAFLLVLAASGCSAEKPAAGPPPVSEASPTAQGGLRPLTSRDEAKPVGGEPALPADALPAGHPPLPARHPPLPAASEKTLAGTVSIAPKILGRTSPKDVLYLIARSRTTNAVVAVRREEGVSFPHAFQLSSADAMVADQPFVGPFDITARLSKTGDALPARGDLEGTAPQVADGAKKVSVVIEKVRE
jgi:cytochrome c-type biogenesis protein CcmH